MERANKLKYTISAIGMVPQNVFSGDEFLKHIHDQNPVENHRNILISAIVDLYYKIKIRHFYKIQTIEARNKFIRNQYTKLIHFQGQ